MLDWREKYKNKIVSAEEAVRHIKSGDRVVLAHAAGEPRALVDAMVKRAPELKNVEIVHMISMGECKYCQPGMEKSFRHNAIFCGATNRGAVQEHRADFTPSFFYQVPDLFRYDLQVDVALIQLSLPDEEGNCSFGISADYTEPIARCAKYVIAQVNPNMPYTYGESISLDDIPCIVECDEPIIHVPAVDGGDVARAIAKNVASLIPDGATLQIGIGAIPDAIFQALGDRKDLGIHSELLTDCAVDLIKAGVVTNRKKKIDTGKSVIGFLMGTEKLYEYVDHNPDVSMRAIDYVNNPFIIAQNDNVISVNSAIEVDLMGQANSEQAGSRFWSGVGGQMDFVRGSQGSRGGKSILAFPSTGKGKISKIVPHLAYGTPITVSRLDIQYVVTEFGVALLKGKTLRERSKALIEIAHPDFREELDKEAWVLSRAI